MAPKSREKIDRVNTYIPHAIVIEIDDLAATLAARDPLMRPVSRTDVIKILLSEALAARRGVGPGR